MIKSKQSILCAQQFITIFRGIIMYIIITVSAIAAGIIQTVTGFGAAVFLMLIMPRYFDMVAAPAITSAVTVGLSAALAWKFRRHIQWKNCMFPTIVYLLFSITAISFAKKLDLDHLSFVFGIFLIVLAVYFSVFSERITMKENRKTAALCAMISGITSGFFGIGGPLMAAYFISAIKEKESYIGTIQFLFAFTNMINLFTRIANGIFTIDLLPATILGFAGITVGKAVGLRILDKTDPRKIKKLVYAFVGISGILTLL